MRRRAASMCHTGRICFAAVTSARSRRSRSCRRGPARRSRATARRRPRLASGRRRAASAPPRRPCGTVRPACRASSVRGSRASHGSMTSSRPSGRAAAQPSARARATARSTTSSNGSPASTTPTVGLPPRARSAGVDDVKAVAHPFRLAVTDEDDLHGGETDPRRRSQAALLTKTKTIDSLKRHLLLVLTVAHAPLEVRPEGREQQHEEFKRGYGRDEPTAGRAWGQAMNCFFTRHWAQSSTAGRGACECAPGWRLLWPSP